MKRRVLLMISIFLLMLAYPVGSDAYQNNTTPATQKFDRILKGIIGDRLYIHMELLRDGRKLFGTYSYDRIGVEIPVDGEIGSNGSITLNEYDKDGNTTGIFKCRMITVSTGGQSRLRLEGKWSKQGGSSAQAFLLEEISIDIGPGLRMDTKRIDESRKKGKKGRYTISARYPQVEGSVEPRIAGFNNKVDQFVRDEIASFKKEVADDDYESSDPEMVNEFGISYVVPGSSPSLLSVSFEVSVYLTRTGHPEMKTWTINYDLAAGRRLALSDLFKQQSRYLEAISDYCIKHLSGKLGEMSSTEMLESGAEPEGINYERWTVSDAGLVITFDPYQVADRAAGAQKVMVPYFKLKERVRPGSVALTVWK